MAKKKMRCDTCGREVDQLRRDVLDDSYNAFNKPPLWNCETCYGTSARGAVIRPTPLDGYRIRIPDGLYGRGQEQGRQPLAWRLRRDFLDTDELIEARERRAISSIFKEQGEAYFRELEHACVVEACARGDVVVSLGGGAIVQSGKTQRPFAVRAFWFAWKLTWTRFWNG